MALLCLAGLTFALPLHAAEIVPEPVSGPESGSEVEAEPEGVPAIATSEQVITAIRFTGNRITREQILRQEILVKEGDIADPLLIDRSRQAIMDLGLFTSVRAWLEPQEQGSVLVFAVKEKFYILPVPKLNRDDENNFSLGAELSLDNLAGLNQQLKLRYETEEADAVSGGELTTYTLSYSYPRMFGSAWLLSTELNQTRSPAEVLTGSVVTSLYETEARSASLQLSRWLNLRGPSRGWQAGGGVVWRRNTYEYRSGAPTDTFIDATAVGISLQTQFLDVRDFLYSRSGEHYGYAGEFGEPAIGSDSHYTRHELFYRRYFLLTGRSHENIDLQLRLGLSSGEMFPGETYAYTLGGNKSLRGFDSASFAGNTFIVLNAQYLRPLFGYPMFRGVLFVDIGNAYPSNTEMHLGDLHWDVGLGLRLRLKSFVKIDLRVDVAYAYETGEVTVFAGTKEMF
jgi:outer membrane protein assembly factor BamA